MTRYMFALVMAATFGVSANLWAANITYNVAFNSGINTVSGSITTDGTIGSIFQNNIVSWSFIASGTPTFTMNSTEPSAGTNCGGVGTGGCFLASSDTLRFILNSGTNALDDPYFSASTFSVLDSQQFAIFENRVGVVSPVEEVTWIHNHQTPGIPPGVVTDIATVRPGTDIVGRVPEPGTPIMLGIGLAAILVLRTRKFRTEFGKR